MTGSTGERVKGWLGAHRGEMLGMLETAVNIDSGSGDKPGGDRMCALFRSFLERSGIRTATHGQSEYGDCLSAEVPAADGQAAPHVLLLGHMDTVFGAGTAARRPFRLEGDTAYGPGVADMKAGLVMNAFIARAFAELGGHRWPIRLFFTTDEEVASPASRSLTLAMARGARAVFNAEPGRPSGNVVTRRKGALFVDFEVTGVAAHSGANPDKGASAIEALARKILELHRLADRQTGISSNVGVIRGGTTVNTVADFAAAQLDVRFPAGHDADALLATIGRIVEGESLARTSGRVTGSRSFLPLAPSPASEALLRSYQACGREVGFRAEGESTGGSADSGFTASVGAPTLCATGPVGGKAHTDREYCRIDTMVPRAQAVALTLLALGTE